MFGAVVNPISTVYSSASANQMATISLRNNLVLVSSSHCGHALQFLFWDYKFRTRQVFLGTWNAGRGGFPLNRGFRVSCQSKVILEHPFENFDEFITSIGLLFIYLYCHFSALFNMFWFVMLPAKCYSVYQCW